MAQKPKAKKRVAKKVTTSKLAKTGSQIMTIAKRIRKQSPNKKWTDCVKAAGKEWKKKN